MSSPSQNDETNTGMIASLAPGATVLRSMLTRSPVTGLIKAKYRGYSVLPEMTRMNIQEKITRNAAMKITPKISLMEVKCVSRSRSVCFVGWSAVA